MTETPTPNYDHMYRLIAAAHELAYILECANKHDLATLHAAREMLKEVSMGGRDIFKNETNRHSAVVLLQAFMSTTDAQGAMNTAQHIHLGAIRIVIREVLRRLVAARGGSAE